MTEPTSTVIADSAHALTLGSLDLVSSDPVVESFWFKTLADGWSWGNPEATTSVIQSLMADGDHVRYDRDGNREITLRVQVNATDHRALNAGEAALRRELGKPNTVRWIPPDGWGPTTVYDVVTSWMEAAPDDHDELRTRRTFEVTLVCLPHARSEHPTTVPAIPVAPGMTGTETTIDTCSSLTGWSGRINGAVVAPALFLGTSVALFPAEASILTLVREGAINFASERFLVVQVATAPADDTLPVVNLSTGALLHPLAITQVAGNLVECTFDTGGVSVDWIGIGDFSATALTVNHVKKVSVPPGATPRQQTRIVQVGGTERTPGSIHVASQNGGALGGVIVHSGPEDGSGYSPPLRRWRTAGNAVTADPATFSGAWEAIGPANAFVAEVPTSALPEGGYVLAAMLRANSAGEHNITYSTSTIFPDSTTQEGFTIGTATVNFFNPSVWQFFSLAVLTLPSVRTQGGKVQIAIQYGDASVALDEAWLFRVDDGCSLTVLDTSEPHVWLDSPSLSSLVPTVWTGPNADRTGSHHPGTRLLTMGSHVFTPPAVTIFTATSGTDHAAADFESYKRWHTNAAEDGDE